MITKLFANTDQKVSSIGQGCDLISTNSSLNRYSISELEYSLETGIDLGMNFIDTAETYGDGLSEKLIGRVMKGFRQDVFIATKVAPENSRLKDLISSCESSLVRLQTNYIDLYQVHWRNSDVPISETMEAMSLLVEQGKVKHVGVSNFSMTEIFDSCDALTDIKLASIQMEYNLFDRSAENTHIPFCLQNDLTLIGYSPLDKGNIVNNKNSKDTLAKIAMKHGINQAQTALRWLISQPNVIVIPKSRSSEHLQQNAIAGEKVLPQEDIDEISQACTSVQITVPTRDIQVALAEDRDVYTTLEDAINNDKGYVPSPQSLAETMDDGILKPIRVKKLEGSKRYRYELIEGRIRYWAWIIAKGWDVPIKAIVRE